MMAETKSIGDADIRDLARVYSKAAGKAWEPPNLDNPWICKMIEGGYLRRCTMRCGFEAFDTGVTFTDAGRRVIAALAGLARSHEEERSDG